MSFDPLVGIGMSFVFGFGRWLFPAVPRSISIVGFIAGIVILMAGFISGPYKPPLASLILASIGILALAGSGHIYWQHVSSDKQPSKAQGSPVPPAPPPQAMGGVGGGAVVHGSGTAIGGPGGRVMGGAGIGGAGGSAEVRGDGLAAGGAGGHVGDETYWPAPAKSGYEIAQRALGQPVDPSIRPYGRGGAVAGYEEKLAIVEELRETFFRQHHVARKSTFEDINAVPLDYLNRRLEANGAPWRVLIVDDEYEFFVPKARR